MMEGLVLGTLLCLPFKPNIYTFILSAMGSFVYPGIVVAFIAIALAKIIWGSE